MTMASRDIANMHLFLDLKKKFPDLPDETLRNYVSLFAEDQEKCISLLQKESENHHHPSQPFSDFRLPDSKINSKRSDMKSSVRNLNENSSPIYIMHSDVPAFNKWMPPPSGRSSSHAGVVHLPGKFLTPSMPSKPESYSAPVMAGSDKPFTDMYKQNAISSHTTLCQIPSDRNNQMMFSTTQEHKIEASDFHNSRANLISAQPDQSNRHAVRLSITPSFPFPQQHVNVYNNSVCATASHSSRPGRHTTSLNFQLQPHSSDQFPLEISTIPTNIGDLCNSRDFGSHVQISVGSQGATFTALRLQCPNYSQTQNISHLPTTEESLHEYKISSSQAQNSNLYLFPDKGLQPLTSLGTNESFKYPQAQVCDQHGRYAAKNINPHLGSMHSSEASPEYILAVKNHQVAKLDLIFNALEKEKALCSQLKAEVDQLEKQMAEKNASKSSFLNAEELKKLREENEKLRVECNCLNIEVDMYSSSEIPPPSDFYSHIFTGPTGAVAQNTKAASKKDAHEDDENDERNRWICKNCTFANHPALVKCEICELPKDSGSFFDGK